MGSTDQSLAADEFRHLILEPGRFDDPLNCSLVVRSLSEDSDFPYETISYCWGDASKRRFITINGKSISVPLSSEQALRCLRLTGEARVLWIDALCINQDDLDERAQQVTMMGNIYRLGLRNLIFLGTDPDLVAQEVLDSLVAAKEKLHRAGSLLSGYVREVWQDRRLRMKPNSWQSNPPLSVQDLAPIGPLLDLPWFTRLWIVQEARFARENICHWGSAKFPLDWVTDMAEFNPSIMPEQWFDACDRVLWLAGAIYPSSLPHDITALFKIAQGLHATVSHDRIFAIRDLLRAAVKGEADVELLATDYRKEVGAVFRDATVYILQSSRSDVILSNVHHDFGANFTEAGRTSWTAPWDGPIYQAENPPNIQDNFGSAGTSPRLKNVPFQFETEEDRTVMVTEGFIMPEEALVFPAIGQLYADDNFDMATHIDLTLSVILSEEEAVNRVAVVLLTCGACIQDGDVESAAVAFQELRRQAADGVWNRQFAQSPSETGISAEEKRSAVDELRQQIAVNSSHRRYFDLDFNICSGPKSMQNGDRVAICIGSKFPYIVRPIDLGDDSYYFIGTAYVPGLMDGEVFDMHFEQQEIRLR